MNVNLCPGFPFCLDYNKKKKSDKIIIKQNNHDSIIQCRNIIFCKSDKQYTFIYLTDDRKLISAKNLGFYEKCLPDCFCRIHHSTILNMHFVKEIKKEKNNMKVTLLNGKNIIASCRKKKNLIDKTAILKSIKIQT